MPRTRTPDNMSSDEENDPSVRQKPRQMNGSLRETPGPSSSKQTNKSKAGPANSKKRQTNGKQNGGGDAVDEEGSDDDSGDHLEEVEQNDNDRREIRHNIRSLMTDIKDNKLDYTDPKSDRLLNTLDRANNIFGHIKKTREGALDSQLVLSIAQCGRQTAQRLHTDFLVFNPKNFIVKATSAISGMTLAGVEDDRRNVSTDDWEAFGRKTQHLFKTSPTFQFMFGAIAREPPAPRQPKERRAKEKETNARTDIRQLKSLKEANTEEATSSEVENIYRLLRELVSEPSEPMCYFLFVINSESFSQTVENIFYTSFLVKDGLAKITLDADKLPVIEFIERPKEGTQQADRDVNKTQVVMPLTMREWKEIIEAFGITGSTIPTRPPHRSANLKRKMNPT